MAKTFVTVTAEHDEQGNIKPLFMHWPNGKSYEFDRVLDVRLAPAMKAGGMGCCIYAEV
ncbi:hypothetical protein [Sporomusa aerivorans]|uniref:hypothetical protein n=1 Tax=Sporomusa aerivorans TaxID=204936 RepID=UPI00352B11A8